MNTILYKLLDENKHFLQALHACIGLDFKKDMYVFELSNKFTINQILKQAAAAGYTPNKDIFVMLINPDSGYKREYKVAALNDTGKLDRNIKSCGYNNNNHVYFHDIYTKSDFDYLRQIASHTIVICQKRDFLKLPCFLGCPIDHEERFKLKKINSCYCQDQKYIASLTLQVTTNNGRVYQHETSLAKTNNISDLIDKSGYLLFDRRNMKRRKAAIIRAEKAKNQYINIDNTEKLNVLKEAILEKKQHIVELLKDATTANDLSNVIDKLSYFNGLKEIMKDYEKMSDYEADKAYKSIESFNSEYESMLYRLNKI